MNKHRRDVACNVFTSGFCIEFLKYENNKEKTIIENIFKRNFIPIDNFNIATNILQTTDNIIVIKL